MLTFFLVAAVLFLAYANGANDNFKGVATLYGSRTTSYTVALAIATVATLAGALASFWFAQELFVAFSGKGLVPHALAASPQFLLAVAAGAALTVITATRVGMPVSSTHALLGALVGGGIAGAGGEINFAHLGGTFFLPLLLSPMAAALLTMPLYALAQAAVGWLGVTRQSCVCVAAGQFVPAPRIGGVAVASLSVTPQIVLGEVATCVNKYEGALFGVRAQSAVDGLHYASAAAVCFARGLNDTPKILGLLFVVTTFDLIINVLAVALAMGAGGLFSARRVAHTMSQDIARMNDGQSLVANLVTAMMVIAASKFGLPVSTTHVSVGAISGIGVLNGSANWPVMRQIALSWVGTLPLAACLSALFYAALAAIASPPR